MRVIRAQVRTRSSPELTIPQFRALAFVGRNDGPMLADVAAFLGLTPPAASKIIDVLVAEKHIVREEGSSDRRRIALRLTPAGRRKYQRVLEDAENYMAERIEQLDPDQRGEVIRGLEALHAIFEDPAEMRRSTAKRKIPA
jgi:DNA-binding MarR family transcriptional regulator